MGVAQGADSTNPAVHHCWPCWKCFIWDGPRHWHANEACSDWPLSIDFRALKDFVQCVSRNFRLLLFGAQTNCPFCPDRNESKASDTSVAWDEPQNAKSSALVAAEQLRHEWYVLVALPRTCTITFAELLSIMTVSSYAVLVCDSPEVCQVIAKLSISCRFCFRLQPFSAKRCSVDCDTHLHMDGVLELRSLNSFFCCRWGSAGLKLALVSRLWSFVSHDCFDDFHMLVLWFEMFPYNWNSWTICPGLPRKLPERTAIGFQEIPSHFSSLWPASVVDLCCFIQDLQNSSNGPFSSCCSVYQIPSILVSFGPSRSLWMLPGWSSTFFNHVAGMICSHDRYGHPPELQHPRRRRGGTPCTAALWCCSCAGKLLVKCML